MNQDTLFRQFFAPLILLAIAYEWLISGLNKVLYGHFVQQMQHELILASKEMQYSFYSAMFKQFVIPNAPLFALLVEVGEILIGVSYVIIALAIFSNNIGKTTITIGIWTSIISAFMVLNFFFYQGGAMFLNTGDPFDEGIPIDFILFLMQLFIAIFFITLHRINLTSTRVPYRRYK